MSKNPIDEILNARSIAIVGASPTGNWGGGGFLAGLVNYDFKGKIYPVNPKYTKAMGQKVYPSLLDVPGEVDYVISCVSANRVLEVLEQAVQKEVKAAHLFTARLAETGREEGLETERKILELSRKSGMRLIGPNCMGIYSPANGIAFHGDFPKECGPVGLISQSGMLAREIVKNSPLRGVYFSKVFSYGNGIDLNETDFLDYLADDQGTSVILCYIEGTNNGHKLLNSLKYAAARKPVVVLKGGKGQSGERATASHTASLAGNSETWNTLVTQTGAVMADSIEELIDLAVTFRFLPPVKGNRVGVAGGAGGSSVLAADASEKAGLDVVPLSDDFRQELKAQGVSVWDWLGNPADLSIREDDSLSVGLVLEMMAKDPDFDLLIAIMGMPGGPPGKPWLSPEETMKQQYRLEVTRTKPFLSVVADKSLGIDDTDDFEWKGLCRTRTSLINLGIPFYPTIQRAAVAARKAYQYYQRLD
ncbi:MAG: CoA-binding protein [Dehalococcoidales bacterium]|nr:MAG: CoA-binding protein [Dehalococcoidales bacterium]